MRRAPGRLLTVLAGLPPATIANPGGTTELFAAFKPTVANPVGGTGPTEAQWAPRAAPS
jgi:hypothetical protein